MLYCLQMVFSAVRGSGRYVGSAVVGAKVGYPVGGVEGEVVGISDIDGAADGERSHDLCVGWINYSTY